MSSTLHLRSFLIIIMFFYTACKRDDLIKVECTNPTSEISKVKSLIKGSWTWAYEKYYNRFDQVYVFKNSQTEGVSKKYFFFTNHNVNIYKNNIIDRFESFEVTTLNVVTGVEADIDEVILLFKDKSTGQRTDFAPVQICNDTLTLNYHNYSDTRGQEKWFKN